MKTIVGLYDDIATARRVVEELAAAGFQRGDISLVANNQTTGTTTTGMTGGEPSHEPISDAVVFELCLVGVELVIYCAGNVIV